MEMESNENCLFASKIRDKDKIKTLRELQSGRSALRLEPNYFLSNYPTSTAADFSWHKMVVFVIFLLSGIAPALFEHIFEPLSWLYWKERTVV